MNENAIKIEFSHEIKGLLGRSTITEREFYFLDGFSAGTIADLQEKFFKDIKKALNYMEKAPYEHTMIDICFNDDLEYRFIMDYENGEKGLYVLTFNRFHSSYLTKDATTKKDALRLMKDFYIKSLLKATA